MSNHKWEAVNDKDFEAILEDSVSALPPDNIVANVTPWKKSMNRVLIGMALTAITLNFWYLNYILPTIGIILMLLGFRTLKSENKWFKNCFILSVIRAIYLFPSLILNTTILQSAIYTAQMTPVLTIVNLALIFVEFVCLWRGFISVQKKAGLPPHASAAVALIVWYALMCLLALIQYNGLIIGGAMIVGYIFIIRNLYKLSKELDEAGYTIHLTPVKVTDRGITLLLVAILLIGCICGYAFGSSYPMEWTELNADEHAGVADIKAHLLSLGFPEYVLNDLTAEDIAACAGALQVVTDITDEPADDGRTKITEHSSSEGHHIVQDAGYDTKKLRITGVGVQIAAEQERWIIFHHFLWIPDSGFHGTESIQLWPVYQSTPEGWCAAGPVTGRVLHDQEGQTFTADYYSLGFQNFTSSSIFWGEQSNTDIFATFSMPYNSQQQRGYLAYPVDEVQDGYIIDSWVNYTYQYSWFQYPAVTAMEKRMSNAWNNAGAFKTIQNALQFYPERIN